PADRPGHPPEHRRHRVLLTHQQGRRPARTRVRDRRRVRPVDGHLGRPRMTIEITDERGAGIDLETVRALTAHVCAQMRIHPDADVYVRFVEPGPMTDLHVQWMDLDGPTDVMSFPMDELRPGDDAEPGVLGDIVVCSEVA